MAEAVLEVVLENLSSLIQKELGLVLGVNQEMRRLASILTTIKAVLEDAEQKQFTDKALKNWLSKLKDAAHMLDDILDHCSTEALSLEYQGLTCGSTHMVHGSCLSSFHPKHVLFRHRIARKMKDIRERLDDIADERLKFHLSEIVIERRRIEVPEWRQTTSIITESHLYGRDEEKEKIVDFLVVDASNSEELSVYPIIGIGGLGKTTLAQLVFNDERVVNHFELKIWVCVSEDFSLKRMSKVMIESISKDACADLDLETLQRRLQELLGSKRYLLVLDDVWNENQERWNKLKHVLACGSKGASILVTTRLGKVASIMGTVSPHELSMLSEEDCWELFKEYAFRRNNGESVELAAIGKEIVNKCKGVPLAAKALGSLLQFKNEEKDWVQVKESKIWNLPQDEYSILPALRLSYLDLTPKLRQCFAYCSLFPKDEEISKKKVIELWMANGFISSNGRFEVEDDGDRVWKELHLKSFFQDVQISVDMYGYPRYDVRFKMHDLVHDLAESVMEDECWNDSNASNLSGRIRHISIYPSRPCNELSSLLPHQAKSLKAFLTMSNFVCNLPLDILMKCHSLRLLDMMNLKMVPSSIGHLKLLRHLNLSCGTFKTLPDSICELWNLQILNLDYCEYLRKLPNHMKCLKSLRHLHLNGCRSLSNLAPAMGQLTSLKTLNEYIVGKKKGFLLGELGGLNLRGSLHLKHLERVKSVTDAIEANMADKHLNELVLLWKRNEDSQSQENVEQILEALQPYPQQLQTLLIGGYMGNQLPIWMGNPTLKDLLWLRLVDCKNLVCISILGKLPSLEDLRLSNMNQLQFLDDGSYDSGVARGFRALKILVLDKLPNLVKLSKEDGDNMFPCLSKLQIIDCPLLSFPSLPSVIDLKIQQECNEALLQSIQNLHNLECLSFLVNKELTSFPDGMLGGLTCLKQLQIYELDKLEVLPTGLSNLNALEKLHIEGCNNLETLTVQVLQGLLSLRVLKFIRCAKLQLSAGFRCLTSLENLVISSCPEVIDLPDDLQHIVTLQSLTLYDLTNLASLPHWLGRLGLLNSLFIYECPKLEFLPMSIQCLSNLKILEIYGCPELLKRCKKETGEDWHKIVHIPHARLQNIDTS